MRTASAARTGANNEATWLPHKATVTIDQHKEYSAREHQCPEIWVPCC